MKRKLTAILAGLCLLFTLTPFALADSAPNLAALTFDDGPGPYARRLLDGLRDRGARARSSAWEAGQSGAPILWPASCPRATSCATIAMIIPIN